MKAKAYKVTISGSYRTNDYKIVDFSGVEGIIPFQDEEIATMHIRDRYARMWIMKDSKFKERLVSTRECHIDNLEACDHDFSYLGKDIREMSQEELQDLATAKDLRLIPLYKIGSEREARTRAYAAYSAQVLMQPVKYQEAGFNLMKQPPLIINDGSWRRDNTRKLSNEEIMDGEEVIGATKTSLSRMELEQIAKSQNITYHPSISDMKLHQRIYGQA